MDAKFFVHNVKARCKAKGVKPTTACQESGAGKSLLSDVMRGVTPSIERIQKLAAYLGCTVSDLLGEAPLGKKGESPSEDELSQLLQGPYMREIYDALERLTPETRKLILAQIEAVGHMDWPELPPEGGTKK